MLFKNERSETLKFNSLQVVHYQNMEGTTSVVIDSDTWSMVDEDSSVDAMNIDTLEDVFSTVSVNGEISLTELLTKDASAIEELTLAA